MSKLLINEYPLQVLPTLAKAIGLNEAMVLQQIHYWISNPKVGKVHNAQRWIYNSVREWQEEQFPFWSTATIARALKSLRDKGLVEALDLNDAGYDKTLWYTINYEALNRLQESIIANCHNGLSQNDIIDSSNMIEPIPETNTESTSETTTKELGDVFSAFENNISQIGPVISEQISAAYDEFGSQWLLDAIEISAKANKRSWSYINGILKRWRENGKQEDKPPIGLTASDFKLIEINGEVVAQRITS